jgi:threonyl-tRNA synthetase
MMGILIEHTAGKWPFWLSPRQVSVLPVSEKYNDYAQQVTLNLKNTNISLTKIFNLKIYFVGTLLLILFLDKKETC